MQRAIDGPAAGGAGHGVNPDAGRLDAALLEPVLSAASDGVLAVDREGRITAWNPRLLELWTIPDDLIAARDAARVEAFMANQMPDPAAFLRQLAEIDASANPSGLDILELAGGQVY